MAFVIPPCFTGTSRYAALTGSDQPVLFEIKNPHQQTLTLSREPPGVNYSASLGHMKTMPQAPFPHSAQKSFLPRFACRFSAAPVLCMAQQTAYSSSSAPFFKSFDYALIILDDYNWCQAWDVTL